MTDERLGTGVAVFQSDERIQGTAHFVQNPQEVIELTGRDDLEDLIGVVRAGTSAFASPLLANGVGGLLTMEGAPTSHLGILSREYNLPCIMSVEPVVDDIEAEADSAAFFEEWGSYLDGHRLRLDCSQQDGAQVRGEVYLAEEQAE